MDIKKNLRIYMQQFPMSFVGFFDTVSDVLKDLGDEWDAYGEANKDAAAKEYGVVFLETSKSAKTISEALAKIADAHVESQAKENEKDPIALIEAFKSRVKLEVAIK